MAVKDCQCSAYLLVACGDKPSGLGPIHILLEVSPNGLDEQDVSQTRNDFERSGPWTVQFSDHVARCKIRRAATSAATEV